MISKLFKAVSAGFLAALAVPAFGSTRYILTLKNGGNMPLSPAVIYAVEGEFAAVEAGDTPSPGFIQLCQTGNPAARASELAGKVKFITQTSGLILPGEASTVEVEVEDPTRQSIHFETMYGKSKDVCAVGGVGTHGLQALSRHLSRHESGRDDVLQTGAFTDPVINAGANCATAADAVHCLRELAAPNMGAQHVKFFAGYLPSVVQLLESKYGSEDTLSLQLPVSGAVQFDVRLLH